VYFAACIPPEVRDKVRKDSLVFAEEMRRVSKKKHYNMEYDYEGDEKPAKDTFIPSLPLKVLTIQSLVHLACCDSVTVDPHKSGYIQYPAGGLLYRDERMRHLLTWKSPIVYRNDQENIGIYGVEGRSAFNTLPS